MTEGYPDTWKRVTLMVSPTGEFHAIGGDRAQGDGDTEFLGMTPIKKRISALQQECEKLTKELAFRDFAQARASDIALNYGPYDEIQKSLSSEISLHAAWMKRANESESEFFALQQSHDRLLGALKLLLETHCCDSGEADYEAE